jgi:hypothetical protein
MSRKFRLDDRRRERGESSVCERPACTAHKVQSERASVAETAAAQTCISVAGQLGRQLEVGTLWKRLQRGGRSKRMRWSA